MCQGPVSMDQPPRPKFLQHPIHEIGGASAVQLRLAPHKISQLLIEINAQRGLVIPYWHNHPCLSVEIFYRPTERHSNAKVNICQEGDYISPLKYVFDYNWLTEGKRLDQFTEWLQAELDKRSWLANDLAKRAGLGSGSLSQIMNGYRKPGPDLCRSIAAAMHLPEELVFRQAGLLSPKTENCVADHAKGLIDLLNKHQLDYVVEVIQWRLSLQDDDDPPTSEDRKSVV